MPRRRPDTVYEHRISLSDFERQRIDEVITTAQANVAVDGITATLTAASGIGLAGAALLGAFVFMKWKGPDIVVDIIEKAKTQVEETFTAVGDVVLPGQPVSLRTEAKELAKERGALARLEATYCSFSSGKYDEAECSVVQQRKDAYFVQLEALREKVNRQRAENGALGYVLEDFVYSDLGDIDPNYKP